MKHKPIPSKGTMDVLTSPTTVQLVPWLRRKRVHLPPTFSTNNNTVNLAMIQQYAQNLTSQEWEQVAAQIRFTCAQHGWTVLDSIPLTIVSIPSDQSPEQSPQSEQSPEQSPQSKQSPRQEEVEAPKPEDIIEVPAEEAPKRRKKVVRVKRVTNKKK